MKRIIIGLTLLSSSVGFFSACRDKAKDPQPAVDSVALILPRPSADTSKRFIAFDLARLSDNEITNGNLKRPEFEFSIDPLNQRDIKVDTIIMYKSYRTGKTNFTYHPRVFVEKIAVSQLPVTRSYDSKTLFTGLRRIVNATTINLINNPNPSSRNNNLVAGESAVVFTFEYIAEGGRRIQLTPVTTQTYATVPNPSTVDVIGGTQANYPYAAVAEIRKFFK